MLAEELSCWGTVTHVRRAPMRHVFRYRVWMLYMRLGPDGAGPALWPRLLASSDKGHLMSGDGVRSKLHATGFSESEVASMDLFALTQPRSLGFSFNPVNFYFCLAGERLAALLLDVNNTPWDERHCYVLLPAKGDEGANDASFRFAKRFHVSPFLPMDGRYTLHLKASGDALRIAMRFDGGTAPFSACLSLKTRPLARSEVVRSALRQPAQGVLTLARIYWQAGRLFLKRAPFHAHPAKLRATTPVGPNATRAPDAAAAARNGSAQRPGERGS